MSDPEILIVEDEEKIARLLEDYLRRESFGVDRLAEGGQAVERIRERRPALVVLDLMLPGKDGIEICREVRQFSDVPILMLTAKVDEIDRLLGLRIGADDYVCKPFSAREVVARVQTILRRVRPAPSPEETEASYAGIRLVLDRFLCRFREERIDLTPVEFRLLWTLISHPGRVFSRESLMRLSYPDDRIVSDRTIDTHVKNLRRKLVRAGVAPDLIQAVYGVGYKIETAEPP
ncbi:response regulator [Imhoffiella purpurea]|uniref:Response regulator BaeR n=1 Tax=Imhoffiella purpurea TaxID=1249627 RepID=W9VYX6_9GAMM|nr:response regulator [Imhoffiella purpurea]EXJ15610.1 Response regulator BaeR [Imhoffiella purpurea]